jgi:hypothetical protein
MAATNFGTFDELLDITPDPLKSVVRQLRKIVLEVDPYAVEVVRLGDRAATFGTGPQKMKQGYVYVLPHKSWVNLGFFRGVALSDKKGLLEGSGKSMRHIKVHTVEQANDAAVRELIKLAADERKTAEKGK